MKKNNKVKVMIIATAAMVIMTGCGSQKVESREAARTDDSVSTQLEVDVDSEQIIIASNVMKDTVAEKIEKASEEKETSEEKTDIARNVVASVASDTGRAVVGEKTESTKTEGTVETTQTIQSAQRSRSAQSTSSTQSTQTTQQTWQTAQNVQQMQQAEQNIQQPQTVEKADTIDETVVSNEESAKAAENAGEAVAQAGETNGIDNVQIVKESVEITVTIDIPPVVTEEPDVEESEEPAEEVPVSPIGRRICNCGHTMEIYTYGLSGDEKAAWKAHAKEHLLKGEPTNYHDAAY